MKVASHAKYILKTCYSHNVSDGNFHHTSCFNHMNHAYLTQFEEYLTNFLEL